MEALFYVLNLTLHVIFLGIDPVLCTYCLAHCRNIIINSKAFHEVNQRYRTLGLQPRTLRAYLSTYLYCRAAAAICVPLLAWAWNRRLRYWYYEYFPIAYPGDVKPNRLQRRYDTYYHIPWYIILTWYRVHVYTRLLLYGVQDTNSSYQHEIWSTLQTSHRFMVLLVRLYMSYLARTRSVVLLFVRKKWQLSAYIRLFGLNFRFASSGQTRVHA